MGRCLHQQHSAQQQVRASPGTHINLHFHAPKRLEEIVGTVRRFEAAYEPAEE